MPFQPFGYPFEVNTQMPTSKVKALIRTRKKRWLDPKNGPRGWIAGPFICLWMSVFDRYGPMLIGRISQDSFGTRITGRAGSDLNGMAALALWLPLMVFVTYIASRAHQMSLRGLIVIGIIIVLSPLAFWFSDKDKKQAEPLVRFVRNAITPSGQSLRASLASANIKPDMSLTESGQESRDAMTGQRIYNALQNAGLGDSVIISSGAETYLQTLLQADGFVIERRDGDRMHHFKAVRRGGDVKLREIFTFEETLAAMIAYGSGSVVPETIGWEPMELPE